MPQPSDRKEALKAPQREMTGEERMLAACRLQPVDATPIWFMRQAGRCFPEYRRLREKHDLLTIAKTPDLCAQVTLLPVRRLGVDAAILFADIMLPLEGMGVPFSIEPEIGPIIPDPIRTEADVDRLKVLDAEEATPYVFQALRLLRRELGETAALVGFAGSPFTLACYMVEGGPSRDYPRTKALMFAQPDVWRRLMERVTEVIVRYLRAQMEAGIQVAQLFDSWVGILSPQQYEEHVLPHVRRIFAEVRDLGVPTIYFGTGAASLLELMASTGSDVLSVDWRVPLDQAWARIGHDLAIQGNLDPTMLLAPYEVAREGARDVLHRAGGRPGHIFNLGHGLFPETDPDDLARLVDFVRQESQKPLDKWEESPNGKRRTL